MHPRPAQGNTNINFITDTYVVSDTLKFLVIFHLLPGSETKLIEIFWSCFKINYTAVHRIKCEEFSVNML